MKNELAETAMRLWQTYGYDSVSINRICSECGGTKGSFYHHFHSKEEVIEWYVGKKLQKTPISRHIDSMTGTLTDILEQLTEPVMELNTDILLVLITGRKNEIPGESDSMFFNSGVYQNMLAVIRNGQDSGEFRKEPAAEELLKTVLSVLTGNLLLWCLNRKYFDLLEEDKRIIELLLKTGK